MPSTNHMLVRALISGNQKEVHERREFTVTAVNVLTILYMISFASCNPSVDNIHNIFLSVTDFHNQI